MFWCKHKLQTIHDPLRLGCIERGVERTEVVSIQIVAYVRSAEYRDVEVRVEIVGAPFEPDTLRRDVSNALARYAHPVLGGTGDEPWPFGATVRPSELLRVAQKALTEQFTVTRVGVRIHPRGQCEGAKASTKRGCECGALSREGSSRATSSSNVAAFDEGFVYCDEFESELRLLPQELAALRQVHVHFIPPQQTGGLL